MDKTAIRLRPTKWRKIVTDKDDYFYIPIEGEANLADKFKHCINPGDSVHVSLVEDREDYRRGTMRGFRGYGGSTLEFPLEDGTVDRVKGPWHTHTDALYKQTGLLITDLHYTFTTIGTASKEDAYMEVDPDSIIYQDPGWVLGPFMRGERLAHQLADALSKKLYVACESYGGASAGWIEPNTKPHPMARRASDENVATRRNS